MGCCLTSPKPLSEPMLENWEIGTNFSEMLIGIHTISFKKMHLKSLLPNWRPSYLCLNVLRTWYPTFYCRDRDNNMNTLNKIGHRAYQPLLDLCTGTLSCVKVWTIHLKSGSPQIKYHQISNIRCTKSQTLNVSCLVLQFTWPNQLKSGIKPRMKM